MAFISKNELEQFEYDDCLAEKVEKSGDDIVIMLSSLIVKERNSQNANFTRSYADTARLTLKNAAVESIIIAGYRVYDANDNLLEEVPDRAVEIEAYADIFKKISGYYMYRVLSDKADNGFVYDFEFENADTGEIPDMREDAFVVRIRFSEAVISWDRYLNRVQG